jgi:predicted TIM-barrel fold metal-dependent hydrolase
MLATGPPTVSGGGLKEAPLSSRLGFPVFDADNHLYETRDALTKYLPDSFKGVIDYVDLHGRTKIVVRGQISDYIPNPTFDRVGRPGAQEEYFKHGNPEGRSQREIIGRGIDCPPAFRHAEARLQLLDEQDVDYALMLPTLASLLEERVKDDPDLSAAAIHALNLWMREAWPFTFENRIFSTPIVTPGLVGRAVEELEWLVGEGARAILMRPAPAWGYKGPRSFALPEFDPFWELVQESGVLVVLHASDSGYIRYSNEWEGVTTETQAFAQLSPFTLAINNTHRDIQDAVRSLICHGTVWRFPRIRVALIENGAGWVPGLLENLDHTWSQMPQAFGERPSETFKKNFWMHPFHEEDPRELVELLGPDHVIFGSDFPHVEGLADPLSWAEELHGLDHDTLKKVMGGNMMDLLGISAPVAA